jgi:hypothetical protein
MYLEEDCDMTTFLVAKIYDYVPKDWKDAMCKMNGDEARKWFAANVYHDSSACNAPGRDARCRSFPNYTPKEKAA